MHRPVGCEYVNAYNPIVAATLKCNHDAQFVLASDSKDTAGYVCKCIKKQNQVENELALTLAAFTKAASKASTLPADTPDVDRGYKILSSMLYAITNGQEIAAPMAALYIERESLFWFLHEFVHVDMERSLANYGETREITVSAHSRINDEPASYGERLNLLELYWRRQPALEDTSFITVCEQYEVVHKTRAKRCDLNNETLPFTPENFTAGGGRKILVLCGRQLPDIGAVHDQPTTDFYYMVVLSLFKPHREMTLLRPEQTPMESYRGFIQSGNANVSELQAFEAKWRDFYQAEATDNGEEESAKEALLRTRTSTSSTRASIERQDNSYDGSDTDVDEFLDGDDDIFEDLAGAPEAAHDIEEALASINCDEPLHNAISYASAVYPRQPVAHVEIEIDPDTYRERVIRSAETPGSDHTTGTHTFIQRYRDAPTRLERLRECFEPVPWWRRTGSSIVTQEHLPEFPKIRLVSQAFQLNFWQHAMFEVAARHLLYSYSKDIEAALDEPMLPDTFNKEPYEIKSQLIAYLGGEAGTGKSQVVHALLAFASKWGREGTVKTLAFTGVAAINIEGRTMHSARNLNPHGVGQKNVTLEMKARFADVVLVIIDEILMTDQTLLGRTDAAFRSMCEGVAKCKAMGGRHVLLIGDWLQLPPVGGVPCFVAPSRSTNIHRHQGYDLYHNIKFVVFLTENMRAKHDQAYANVLASLRWGSLSDEQLCLFNSRVLREGWHQHAQPSVDPTFYKPLVAATNRLRCAINRRLIIQISYQLHVPVYECVAHHPSRSQEAFDRIKDANDDTTDRVPMRLLFYVGMPVMVTQKHPDLAELDVIANGIMGTIVGFSPPEQDTPFHASQIDGLTVKTLIQLPRLLLVKVRNCSRALVEGFPEGTIGIPPLQFQVNLKARYPGQKSITVRQFPVVPAFACTAEKLQGQTCTHGIVLTPLEERANIPPQVLYVALSRSVSLANVTLTQPMTHEYVAKFTPTTTTVAEMSRLLQLVQLPPYISSQQAIEFSK